MEKENISRVFMSVIFVSAVFFVVFYGNVLQTNCPSNHTWGIYKNDKYNFAISYPSDISNPNLKQENSDMINFFDLSNGEKVIYLWVQRTNIKDINDWFSSMKENYSITNIRRVADVNAISYIEKGQENKLGYYNLHLIKDGYFYSLYIRDYNTEGKITQEDIDYIVESFHFLK
jgi:hypothetical protein